MKMADGVVIDLYADDLDVKDFNTQPQDDFNAEGVDLYDDISVPNDNVAVVDGSSGASAQADENSAATANGVYHQSGSLTPNHMGRRYQLYVGNLTWWTTDQDISNTMRDIGVADFQEVKFFENRSNGQSKGFCVISLGSENSMRVVMERLAKKELHGQVPVVTYPTKQALNQFESQQKTRPVPPQQNGPRGPIPNMGGMPQHPAQGAPPGHQPRMMNPNMPPGQFRPQHMPQNMQGPPGPNQGPPRMQPPPMHQGGPMGPQSQMQGPPRYPNQGQWNGPRPNGPRPGPMNGPPHQQRPQMFQGPPGGMPPRGPRPDWSRPPMHGGFPPQGPPGPPQGPPHMQGPPRGPPPPQMGGPGGPPHGGPAPHVNPAFFNQGGGPPQHGGGPPMGGPHGPPGTQAGMAMPHQGPPHFAQQGAPRGPWPGAQAKPAGPFPEQAIVPQLNEVEFEEIMGRNRTVSSSAIARAVSDAAAGEYSSAIETLVTAISLIKQSKVAHDERCKILISSLQDTLHGIETKSYNRRERSRSRERTHRSRPRRERSSSRYRERSRDRERDRDREAASYRERSRSRERERATADHYRDDSSSRSARPRKSPEPVVEVASDPPSKRSYYEERYRSSDRDRDRERDRERERDRDRDRERDRDRREEHRSRH